MMRMLSRRYLLLWSLLGILLVAVAVIYYGRHLTQTRVEEVLVSEPAPPPEHERPTIAELLPSPLQQIKEPPSVLIAPQEIIPVQETKPDLGNLYIEPTLVDATGTSNVRKTELGAEVGYRISETSRIGAVSTAEIADRGDKAVWREAPEDEKTAAVKYRLSF